MPPKTSLYAPAQGVDQGVNFSSPLHRGTTLFETWYSGMVAQLAYTPGGQPVVDQIRAYPVVIGRDVQVDRVAFEITAVGGAGSKARCAIYRATSKFNIYPKDLMIDGGEFLCDAVAGIKSTTPPSPLVLAAGLYWFAVRTGVATPTFRTITIGANNHILGIQPALGTNGFTTLSGGVAYGAFPDPCPAGLTGSTNLMAAVHVRFAQ